MFRVAYAFEMEWGWFDFEKRKYLYLKAINRYWLSYMEVRNVDTIHCWHVVLWLL